MWQIPLQNRWGCGYIYDKNLISEEDAKKEVIEYIGMDVEFNKPINFEPGTYNNIWVENCLMVGLSGGFLEPLEATSIMTIILELSKFIECKANDDRDTFNKYMDSINLQNMLFIRHHYNCSRNDTPFWKLYRNTELPERLKLITKGNFISIKTQEELMEVLKVKNTSNMVFSFNSYILINVENFVKQLEMLGYKRNSEGGNTKSVLWQMADHYNHVHVSNTEETSTTPDTSTTGSTTTNSSKDDPGSKIMGDLIGATFGKVLGLKEQRVNKEIDKIRNLLK
jgi:hypothetical protein